MKKHLTVYFILGISFLIILGFFIIRNDKEDKAIDESRTVYVKQTKNGFQLIRNGKPFLIRGASGNSFFKELSHIGGNTIRIYDTLNLGHVLDEAHDADLAVIVDIPLTRFTKENCSYLDEKKNNIVKQKIKHLVNQHSGHPALLFWNLGNELKYPSIHIKRFIYNLFDESTYEEENSFIKTFNDLIDIIHREDPNHPVSTAIDANNYRTRTANISIYTHSPKIDLLSYNVFGNIENLKKIIPQNSLLYETGPYYISEWGADGWWESEMTSWYASIESTSTKKVEQIKARYKVISEMNDEACLGSLVFYWGEKHERTNTRFSFFKDDYKSEIINELENLWKNLNNNSTPIGLNYMLVDGKGALDDIVFAPDILKTSEIIFSDAKTDSVTIEWEIYPEDWYTLASNKLIPAKKTIGLFKGFEKNKATFITPHIEGPYRIFAYLYDQNGFFASTNTPFYVLNNK